MANILLSKAGRKGLSTAGCLAEVNHLLEKVLWRHVYAFRLNCLANKTRTTAVLWGRNTTSSAGHANVAWPKPILRHSYRIVLAFTANVTWRNASGWLQQSVCSTVCISLGNTMFQIQHVLGFFSSYSFFTLAILWVQKNSAVLP